MAGVGNGWQASRARLARSTRSSRPMVVMAVFQGLRVNPVVGCQNSGTAHRALLLEPCHGRSIECVRRGPRQPRAKRKGLPERQCCP
jgi:hypothetical protein